MNLEMLPDYLKSYDALIQHFRAELDTYSNTEKGDRFAHFIQRLFPQTYLNEDFGQPELSTKKSRDRGIDLTAKHRIKDVLLHGQAKLWIDKSETIDSILSKFQDVTAKASSTITSGGQYVFDFSQQSHFLITTLSKLDGILKRYENREFASKSFYLTLKSEKRLHILDGNVIFPLLQKAYGKITEPPPKLTLVSETAFTHKDNVYFGVISSATIKNLVVVNK
ncbi:MAG: hypothetical protein KC421_28150 [Anaerolineales bacterium]|nr:hypothetical protein [Anaerolineales bacterium]